MGSFQRKKKHASAKIHKHKKAIKAMHFNDKYNKNVQSIYKIMAYFY